MRILHALLGFRFFQFSTSLLRHFCFFKVSYLSDLAADNQGANAPPVSALSLLFLCFRLNSLSFLSRFPRPKSEVL